MILRRAPLALVLLVSAAQANAPLALPEIELIRVDKSERTMRLYAGGVLVHTITGIQLGGAPDGPKRFEGDERTPEGRYVIDWGNPQSAYHLSLHVSYPSADDAAHARAQGRPAGGMIMIHGQPNGLPSADLGARVPGDWTDGCIALANAEIELLWDAVGDGTPIEISP